MTAPSFNTLAPEKRWTGPLDGLLADLRRRAMQAPHSDEPDQIRKDTGWQWVALPKGAFVFVRFRELMDWRLELRIARDEPLTNAAAWDREVGTFANTWKIQIVLGDTVADTEHTHFYRLPAESLSLAARRRDEGKTAIRLMELRRGEVRPGIALCRACHGETPVEWPYMPTGLICDTCNVAANQRPQDPDLPLFQGAK